MGFYVGFDDKIQEMLYMRSGNDSVNNSNAMVKVFNFSDSQYGRKQQRTVFLMAPFSRHEPTGIICLIRNGHRAFVVRLVFVKLI